MIYSNKKRGYPLGPVLAGIIMVGLEDSIVPKLNTHLRFGKRYVDVTLTIAKERSINHVLQQLNAFHSNMQFTFEVKSSGRTPFLHILTIRKKVALKQQFTEKAHAEAFVSTGSHLHPTHGNEKR